jgi:bifunctional non-homologous end joining protein LigD
MTKAAKSAPKLPPFRAQLATLVERPPEGEQWLHEIKYDGYRIGCFVERGSARLESRSGQDWTAAYDEVVRAAASLPVQSALLDGEVAVLLPDGRTSFQGLQNAGRGGRLAGRVVYFVFDLLALDGRDMASLPLEERKLGLAELLKRANDKTDTLRYADHLAGSGADVLAQACKLGLEGIVSKRRDLPYQPGRNPSWQKSKCIQRQEFVVGGFTLGEGQRQGIGSLLLGYYDSAHKLRFGGKVGNGPGFTAAYTTRLLREFERIEQPVCPFEPRPPGALSKQARWVRPERVVEVSFTEWTEGGAVRHPLLQGLRKDKAAKDVRREVEQSSGEQRPEPTGKLKAKPKDAPKAKQAPKAKAKQAPEAKPKPKAAKKPGSRRPVH